MTDYIYIHQPFVNGFVLARIGTFLAAVGLLVLPPVRRLISVSSQMVKEKLKISSVFVGTRALSAIAFIAIHYAISIPVSQVSLINAAQGVQYVFLLLIVVFLSKKFPQLLKEELDKKVLVQKIIAIFLIGLGLGILTF